MINNSDEIKEKRKERPHALARMKTGAAHANVNVAVERLEMLVTIVDRNKADFYADLIQSYQVNMQFTAMAQGTANATMLGLLGLTDSEKAVVFSVVREDMTSEILHTLEEKFTSIKNGKGIAFTIPLTSVIGTLLYGFLSNNRKTVKEGKGQ